MVTYLEDKINHRGAKNGSRGELPQSPRLRGASSPGGGAFWSLPRLNFSHSACFVLQQGIQPKAPSPREVDSFCDEIAERRRKELPRPLYSLVCTLILTHSQKQNRVEKRCISFFPKDQKRGFWRCLPIHSEGYPQDVGLWIFWCAETKQIPKRMKFVKKYTGYAFRPGRNPLGKKRIYRKLPKIPQVLWMFWTVLHNLSQSQNAGVSRASQGFPQFPQALLLLLK